MNVALLFEQLLNGLQFGVLLFLMSAGLTLVMGIMNFVNLAHGSFYMLGAYLAASAFAATGSFVVAGLAAVFGAMSVGLILERSLLFRLYKADSLTQVLATFGLILIANQVIKNVWGLGPVFVNVPQSLSGTVDILGLSYPTYRLAVIGAGLVVGFGLYGLINATRLGMWIRAGAADREMISALGVNIGLVNALVFGLGAALAGFAGFMSAPILSVQPGMGEPILVLALVVIVTGGIGSVRGACYGALIIGIVDTIGRAFLPALMRSILNPDLARGLGPAAASITIYVLMAAVLALRPEGLFPTRYR